ncbi:MAG: energy transducer TonB [Sphingobacteriaceae bacterium]|nr:MAG: energy transducer TonB [Sphingobacteriaceae bacterium]
MLKPVLFLLLIFATFSSSFAQQTQKNAISATVADTSVYTNVDEFPEFPGGFEGLMQFIKTNLRYPKRAQSKGITGRVILGFVIEKDGTLSRFKIYKGIGYGCDEEVIRVFKKSPVWKPGTTNGNIVRVQYAVPISFNL